jgi:hypothetical protein
MPKKAQLQEAALPHAGAHHPSRRGLLPGVFTFRTNITTSSRTLPAKALPSGDIVGASVPTRGS